MTGWCQINGRNALDWPEKFALDVHYVDNVSLWLDLKILFATAFVVLKKQGYAPEGAARAEYFTGNAPTGAEQPAEAASTFTPRGGK